MFLNYNEIDLIVNPSTPHHKCWGLPFDKLKALSTAEGLRVDPERCFFVPPLRAGLGAAERVNPVWISQPSQLKCIAV
jgi:hypothetical protein